jgi:hypothetical protein
VPKPHSAKNHPFPDLQARSGPVLAAGTVFSIRPAGLSATSPSPQHVIQEIFVSIRFISSPAPGLVALPVLALALWTSAAHGQAAAPDTPAAAMQAGTTPAAFRSALEGYQPYTDEKTVKWKEANDTTGRIGGWREYAKEARQPQTPDAAAKPDPRAVPAKP